MSSSTHWVEIDLLRTGDRPPELGGRSDYCVLLCRAGQAQRMQAWFFSLRDPLPTIVVPLDAPLADLPLKMSEVFSGVYDRAYYALQVDYSGPPVVPLGPADALWAEELLLEKRA